MARVSERMGVSALHALPEDVAQRLAGEPLCVRGRSLDPYIQLIAHRAKSAPPFESLTPQEARAAADAAFVPASGAPRALESIEERRVGGGEGELRARLYRPHGLDGPRPLLLYFHQGGFVIGNPSWCEAFCSVIAETARCVVLSVAYRLSPEHRFPAAQEDALAVYRWALEHAHEVDGDPRRVAVGGDSAGGGLAALVAQSAPREGLPGPVLQLLVYPWLIASADNESYRDFGACFPLTRETMQWFLRQCLSDDSERDDPRLSPGRTDSLDGVAPALVYTAGFDLLCDEGRDYAERLEAASVPVTHRCYESLSHSFTSLAGAVPAAGRALQEIAADVDVALSRAPV